MHSLGIAHLDLKPDNILLSRSPEYPHLQIGDLGFATIVKEYLENANIEAESVGTLFYSAPEVVEQYKEK